MGTNLGGIPEEYSRPATYSKNLSLSKISPGSFFELKREFLELSENFISDFIEHLDAMKTEYATETKEREFLAWSKMENIISSEQYYYYSHLFAHTNRIYLERIAGIVFESKGYFDPFYFHVHFAYDTLRKKTENAAEGKAPEKKSGSTKYQRIKKLLDEALKSEAFSKLSEKDRISLEEGFKNKLLFGLKVKNASAFASGLRRILVAYFITQDSEFLSLYRKIKDQFWIQKLDFIRFLEKNKSFLVWIHTLLDNYKGTREMRKERKSQILSDFSKLAQGYDIPTHIERDFLYELQNDSRNIRSFSLDEEKTPYGIFAFMGDILKEEKWQEFLKNAIQFLQVGTLFRRNPDIFYRSNDVLAEVLTGRWVYLYDLQKYFRKDTKEELSLNAIIVQLSKHTLYFYLYPIFLYSIAKKAQLSFNDFRILQDSGLLGSTNMEEFCIVSDFYRDLGYLINKEKNLGLTKIHFSSILFHMRKWAIPMISAITLSLAFSLFFRFPLYFAGLGVLYTVLYILSEFLLSYKLKLARTITGYAMLALFFLLGGFNLNYQQATTERIIQANAIIRGGALDIEQSVINMGDAINPTSMKASSLEKNGSGSVSGNATIR